MANKNKQIFFLGVFLTLLTLVHLLILKQFSPHVVLEELYYIPILFGALRFGLKGALLTFFAASLLSLPFFFGPWSSTYLDLVDRALHLLFSFFFAFLAGYLIERDRRMEKQAIQDRSLKGIGQAATTIVHDLKNPLITILGYSRRIREQKGDPVAAAQTIFESAETMQQIVHYVLDFSKPLQLTLKPENIGDLVRHAVDSCETKAQEAGVTMSSHIPEQHIEVELDRFQVQRALVNLVNNAIEASGNGQSVAISVVPGKDSLRIVIKDNGPGMDRETIEDVFTPFYTRKSGGTGLGMSIAKKIIDCHHGKIYVASKTGNGTAVSIDLPYSPPAAGKSQR